MPVDKRYGLIDQHHVAVRLPYFTFLCCRLSYYYVVTLKFKLVEVLVSECLDQVEDFYY